MRLEADFIIDATGLDANVKANPLLNDLVTHYNLPLNYLGRLSVSNDFELWKCAVYGVGCMPLVPLPWVVPTPLLIASWGCNTQPFAP
jgi:hypothetical protein